MQGKTDNELLMYSNNVFKSYISGFYACDDWKHGCINIDGLDI